jgi:hypothetical protein
MFYKEVMVVYCKIHTKYINSLCLKTRILNVTTVCNYSCYWALTL